MLETLRDYVTNNELTRFRGLPELFDVIGEPKSQYYAACHAIVEVMLLQMYEKKRLVIFHGITDSGKSWIAKIMGRLFISYMKRQTKGHFDEKISELEANV